jgi:hypothetical protein
VVMEELGKHNIRVNSSKLQYRKNKVKVLGVTIDGNVKRPNEIKQNEALEYPSPKSISELRRFLGLSGWFREFIKDYATLT